MKLPARLQSYLVRRAMKLAGSRDPDVRIGGDADPYMLRWWIVRRNKYFNIYLHHFRRSDADEALHDHPWINLSIILTGSYIEHTIKKGGIHVRTIYSAGDVKPRGATSAHRIELRGEPVWSIFITGPTIREWGFHCRNGWKHWRDFLGHDGARRGCGEQDGD